MTAIATSFIYVSFIPSPKSASRWFLLLDDASVAPRSPVGAALNFGVEKDTSTPVPVLAIIACTHDWSHFSPNDLQGRAARLAADTAAWSARDEVFARGVPTGRVVRIPNADHYVHRSNETQVIDELKKFLSSLP